MKRRFQYREFLCPTCGWRCEIRWLPDTLTDPGCLVDDPPDECPECGADMTDVEGGMPSEYPDIPDEEEVIGIPDGGFGPYIPRRKR